MAARVSRVALQVVHLETIEPRVPNPLLEQIGLTDARSDSDYPQPPRATLDILGPAPLIDVSVSRETHLRIGGDRVLSIALSGTTDNLYAPGFEDASIVIMSCAAAAAVTGFEAFELRQPVKYLVNAGPDILTIAEQDPGSRRDSRIAAALTLEAGASCWLVRDPHTSRWRLSGGAVGAVEGWGFMTHFEDNPDGDEGEANPLGFA